MSRLATGPFFVSRIGLFPLTSAKRSRLPSGFAFEFLQPFPELLILHGELITTFQGLPQLLAQLLIFPLQFRDRQRRLKLIVGHVQHYDC